MAIADSIKKENLSNKRQLLVVFVFKYFNFLLIGLVIGMLFIGWTYILSPKYDSITKVSAQANAAKEEQKEVMERYLTRLNNYQESYENISLTEREKLDKVLPQEENVKVLYLKFEQLANDLGLILPSLNIEVMEEAGKAKKSKTSTTEEEKPEEIGLIKISVQLLGTDYETLKRLLRFLENNLRIMDIEELNFGPSEQTTHLKILTYYLKS